MTADKNKNAEQVKKEKGPALAPDPETLHNTDPQDKMKGPVSSFVHNVGEAMESPEEKEEATKKRDERL